MFFCLCAYCLMHVLTNHQYSKHWVSWSRKRTAGRHPLAPCRTDRWKTSSASRLYSPCGKCACRAGTGLDLRTQSPSYKSHTLVFSFQSHPVLDHRHLWGDAGWGRYVGQSGPAPLRSTVWPVGPGWALGGTQARGSAPHKGAAAPDLDQHPLRSWPDPTETHVVKRCHRRWEISDSFPSPSSTEKATPSPCRFLDNTLRFQISLGAMWPDFHS